jgi:hypothetical protein
MGKIKLGRIISFVETLSRGEKLQKKPESGQKFKPDANHGRRCKLQASASGGGTAKAFILEVINGRSKTWANVERRARTSLFCLPKGLNLSLTNVPVAQLDRAAVS